MNLQRPIMLALIGALAVLVIPVLVYRKTAFKPVLATSEQAVAAYTPSSLTIASKPWQQSSLNLPVTAPTSATIQPGTASKGATGNTAAPVVEPKQTPAPLPVVSFIIKSDNRSMAIIGGAVLKEGDRHQEWLVESIERNRVLLRGRKGTRWVTMQ